MSYVDGIDLLNYLNASLNSYIYCIDVNELFIRSVMCEKFFHAKNVDVSPCSMCWKLCESRHFPYSFLIGKSKFSFAFNLPEKTVRFS